MSSPLVFTEVSVAEIEKVRLLAHEIWPVVYQELLSEEQISYMLGWMYSAEKLREDLEVGGIFLLIRSGARDIGFCGFGPANAGEICFLHKIYIAPSHQRKGAGTSSLVEIETRARTRKSSGLRLRVNRRNGPAISLYRKYGLELIGEDRAEIGGGFVMDDYIFEKRF